MDQETDGRWLPTHGWAGRTKQKEEKEASCCGLSWGLESLQGEGLGARVLESHLRRGLAMWASPWARGQGPVQQEGPGEAALSGPRGAAR